MGVYWPDVKTRLGEKFVKIIHDAAVTMSADDMKDVARQLGELPKGPNRVLGRHRTRMEGHQSREKSHLMKEILCDWWNEELHHMSREQGRTKLIRTMRSDTVTDTVTASELEMLNSSELQLENSPELQMMEN